MVDEDLGRATIVYESPDGDTVERTVENEHVAYFQDHWIVKVEDGDDHDVVRRVPHNRVYYVERSVDEFREEVSTLTRQVESIADDLRERLLGWSDRAGEDRSRLTDLERGDDAPRRIDVEDDDAGDGDGGGDDDRPGVADRS